MSLTAPEWARVEVLFPQASTLPSTERASYLDQHCGNEPRVRQEIEAMLAAADTGNDWLKRPVSVHAPERMADIVPAGTRLGAWEIKALIGHGGMGEVYLAERADGAFSMRAAVKLLKRDLIADRNAERFLRERRVLAGLSHPNIARVLDAGTTGDGHPYLVMEYVHGARITDYSRMQALPPKAVVLLMQAVAEAVAEAHRQRIVHRDLKPANVLVTEDGQVKLLDFGIARLLDEPDTAGSLPMTPAYAAPEQINGLEPTPASDVYALGVMLFQLLTQRLPHRREGLPLPVIAASLGAETTERPSLVVFRAEGLLSTVQRLRQAEALAGDLDWIVLKALQADPQRRYQSAGELADDLDRYLEQRPVLARPDSAIYRATRFTQRYPTQVAASLLAVAALTIGLASALWQASIARSEAARAERVKSFLVNVFEQADPDKTQSEVVTARELLENGVQKLEAGLGDDPALRADLYETLSRIHFNLGLNARAIEQAEQSLTLRRELYRAGDARIADSLLALSQALVETRDYVRAREGLNEALRIYEDEKGARRVELATTKQELSVVESGEGRRDASLALQREALAVFEQALGPNHLDTAAARLTLAHNLEVAGQYAEAESQYLQTLATLQNALGPEHSRVAQVHRDLAGLLDRTGRAAEADRQFLHAIAIQRKVYGETHPALAHTLFSHAILLMGQRRFEEADRALAQTLRIYPADSYRAAQSRRYLGLSLNLQERYDEAGGEFKAAIAGFNKIGGAAEIQQYRALADWGTARLRSGEPERALPMLHEAINELETRVGPKSYEVRNPLKRLGETQLALRQYAAAAETMRRVRDLEIELFKSEDHRDLASTQHLLGEALLGLGDKARLAEARTAIDRALTLQRQHQPAAELARTQLLSARLALSRENNAARARQELQDALPLLKSRRDRDEAQALLQKAGGKA